MAKRKQNNSFKNNLFRINHQPKMKSNALFLFLLIVCHIFAQSIFGIPVVDNIKNAAVIKALNEDGEAADQPADGPLEKWEIFQLSL